VATICTTRFNILKLCFLPTEYICVFYMVLKINSDYFSKQICCGDVMCFLWGTNWINIIYLGLIAFVWERHPGSELEGVKVVSELEWEWVTEREWAEAVPYKGGVTSIGQTPPVSKKRPRLKTCKSLERTKVWLLGFYWARNQDWLCWRGPAAVYWTGLSLCAV
jgi:hypothetical protein